MNKKTYYQQCYTDAVTKPKITPKTVCKKERHEEKPVTAPTTSRLLKKSGADAYEA